MQGWEEPEELTWLDLVFAVRLWTWTLVYVALATSWQNVATATRGIDCLANLTERN
jgi:hypothetical protein